jgi:hypothetical protein
VIRRGAIVVVVVVAVVAVGAVVVVAAAAVATVVVVPPPPPPPPPGAVIEKEMDDDVAEAYPRFAAIDAVSEHVPASSKVTTPPLVTVQTEVVREVYDLLPLPPPTTVDVTVGGVAFRA